MDRNDLHHIKARFREQTGVDLEQRSHTCRRPVRTALLIAAVVSLFLLTAAFTWPLFSPLDGDPLTLTATYEGNGLVTIQAENHSFKKLELQPHTRLVAWITGETVTPLSDEVRFTGLTIPPHSTGTITVDLSKAYDMEALESAGARQWYYLILTNDGFSFGQEWKCSVCFSAPPTEGTHTEAHPVTIDPAVLSRIGPELRPYFEDDYYGVFAWNPMHYDYLQTVQDLLLRSGQRIVEPVDPILIIEPAPDGHVFDDTYPAEKQYQLEGQNHTVRDGFGKLVGFSVDHTVLKQTVLLPSEEGTENQFWELPIRYFSTYDLSSIQSRDDHTFIYGQIVSFGALEPYEVYRDDTYVCYDVTHLFYTDLRTYVESIIAMDPDYHYFDDQCWERIVNVYDYYEENLRILSMEEWLQIRPEARIDEYPSDESLIQTGLDGLITANKDLEGVLISIETIDGTPLFDQTLIPTDPRYFDLRSAREASAFILSLEEGVYTLDVTVFLDSTFMSCQSIWGKVFTVGGAAWP